MLDHQPDFAQRIRGVSESKTIKVFSLARRLQQEGRQIISLAVGEPAFDTPEAVISATRRALADQHTRYGPVAGLEALRDRLAAGFTGYSSGNIMITNGAKQALFSIFQILCNPDDEIIVPQPCWVSFTEQIKLAGARPVPVETADHQIDPTAIEKAMTARTKAILINSPNNPTGAVYARENLMSLARLAAARNVYLISDEAYHAFTYDGRSHQSALESAPDPQRVITVRSFSKHFNMTGFRLGYVAGGAKLIQSLARLQSHLTGNVCTFAQYGALAALQMDSSVVDKRRAILQKRRDMAYALARERFTCVRAAGAFYLFPDVRSHLRDGETSEDLAARLLNEAGVAVVPGEAFHGPGHIRISFGMSEADLQRAFEKIKEVL